MKAAFFTQTGPTGVLQYGDLPEPEPQGTQVMIRVRAAAVNPIDTYVRSGAVKKELPSPYIVGADFAGDVVAIGSEVMGLKVGQRVWGCNWHDPPEQGTCARLLCTDQKWVYPLDDNVSFQTAAALALVGITAHLGLVREAGLCSGETVFVNGGSGSVGSAVVQMAKTIGATVITTAGSESKAGCCREFGADAVIEYRRESLKKALQHHAARGVDIWFDVTRSPDLRLAVNSLAQNGRLVVISGREASSAFPVGPFYVKCCRMSGFQLTLTSPDDRRTAAVDINRWMSDGRLKANIAHVLPLSRIADAHRLQEEMTVSRDSLSSGKIVLEPSD